MRLRRAEILGDWYVLDTTGTNCRAQPEGTHAEWTHVLSNIQHDKESNFRRVGTRLAGEDVEFYSPRNAYGLYDFVPVRRDEIPTMVAFLKAELGGIVVESVDQQQIEGKKP